MFTEESSEAGWDSDHREHSGGEADRVKILGPEKVRGDKRYRQVFTDPGSDS